ncbi:hypothetical protein C8P65_10740 [Capnocytophaga leadbetteri]|uniref:Uncharacterized protein n=1 Tax=Capnocytophaga leadbetteri TaxID=327575 RepID=A0A2T5XTY2_9FLAO|nr:hypothetical protein [Capnocytophaga leadbetteri]PTX06384.1 hypothetical protein C8P65_10740 [Capnocytophaga leadbetteri]
MIKIERNTKPFCLIKEKKMDWGEKYDEYSPMFNIILISSNYSLEESIVFFGENNFKKQLLSLYNVINNKEEQERIINYNNERIENRPYILDLIKFYIEKNKDILSPWEKYDLGLKELDFIKIIIYEMEKELYYVNE